MRISKMSGKLEGLRSINTNPLTNNFCKAMSKNKMFICSKCYSIRMLSTYRKTCVNAFEENSKILSKPLKEIPVINDKYFRFSSHGELINMTHLENYLKIARANPNTIFTLWTKRKDLIRRYQGEIPENVVMIYSNPYVNKPLPVPDGFDKIFSVFTKEYAEKNNISINCGGKKCLECLICYHKNSDKIINELIK